MLNKAVALKINVVTIIAVYFLILVGGIVRSMESGMGCPDWPKCFGNYIPPTSAEDLPKNYEQLYLAKRVQKNERLSKLLSVLGFEKLAKKVISDREITKTQSFSTTKAWVEYVNRLVGVLIGFFILLNTALSFQFTNRSIRLLAIGSLILVLFQGWVGSLVVSTNLLPGFISFHMFLALLLVSLLIIQAVLSVPNNGKYKGFQWSFVILLILFAFQIFMGINVREQIDFFKASELLRSDWIGELNIVFYVHRSFSILLMALMGWLFFKVLKTYGKDKAFLSLITVTILELIIGAVMAYFALPFLTQPFHLLLGSVSFGLIVYLLTVSIQSSKKYI